MDVGAVKAVTLEHDGTGGSPGWHVDHVVVTRSSGGTKMLFPCRQWFDQNMADGRIRRRIPLAQYVDLLEVFLLVQKTVKIQHSIVLV